MLPDFLYKHIYYFTVTILTIVCINLHSQRKSLYRKSSSTDSFALFLATILSFFIGLRPVSAKYFGDTLNYNIGYYNLYYGEQFLFSWNKTNFIFQNIFEYFASLKFDIGFFFTFIACVYFFSMLWACKKIFKNDTLLAYIVCIGAFSTYSYSVNGIKAGAAASIFLLALAYKSKPYLATLFLFLSLGFHHAMILPITAYIIVKLYNNPKTYIYGWFFCLLLAALHVTFIASIFAGLTDESGAAYLDTTNEETNKVSGFRPDFILYSAIPIFIGYYVIIKKRIHSETYNFLFCTYSLCNSVFLLCTYGSYINRIAYLSWFMYPILLLYPFVKFPWSKQESIYIYYVIFGHLGFTLFMNYVY